MTQPHRATFDPKEMPDMPQMDTIHIQRNPHVPKPKMTPEREYILCEQAFGLRARGKTYRQMAALLGISVSAAYARAQTFMIAENEHYEHFPSDTRAECESLLRQTVGPVVADAQLGNLASFRALVSYSNTMIKWSKVPNPSRRKLRRRVERIKKYMDEQDPDLSPTRWKEAEMAEQAENARRTSGEQNQQPVAELQVAAENTKSAQSSSKRPGKGGGSAGINVVLMLILLAVATVGPVCRTGPVGLGISSVGWIGTPVDALLDDCALEKGPPRQGGPTLGPVCRTGPVGLGISSVGGIESPVGALWDACALEKGPPRQGGPTERDTQGETNTSPSRLSSSASGAGSEALLGGRMVGHNSLKPKLASFKQWHDSPCHAARDLQPTASSLRPNSGLIAPPGGKRNNSGFPFCPTCRLGAAM